MSNRNCSEGRRLLSRTVVAALLCLAAVAPVEATHEADAVGSRGRGMWSYTGETSPEHWADLSSRYATCREGQLQSPIDIRGARSEISEPLIFRYRSNPLTVINDGHTVRVEYEPGSYIGVGSHRYGLIESAFHVPGEHRVNGATADMVAQLIHRDGDGNLAVVEIPFVAGRRMNSVLTRIWDNLPDRPQTRYYGSQVGINPTFLLPNEKSYFSYVGSLTTPPCTEGVRWFVFSRPVEVDASYIRRLVNITGPNARPVQPSNGRPVTLESR